MGPTGYRVQAGGSSLRPATQDRDIDSARIGALNQNWFMVSCALEIAVPPSFKNVDVFNLGERQQIGRTPGGSEDYAGKRVEFLIQD